jgi:uncharacterized protein (DUF2141 family)
MKNLTLEETEMKFTRLVLRRIAVSTLVLCALPMTPPAQLATHAQVPAMTSTAQADSTLSVRITGLRNTNGKVSLTLYRDSKPIETRVVAIDGATLSATTVFGNMPQGVYAVYVFHDENLNGKMDSNFVGMPVEGYGMSNNPKKRMGRPGFDETNFLMNQPKSAIEIKMIYWQ